jgi:hypothetical protein
MVYFPDLAKFGAWLRATGMLLVLTALSGCFTLIRSDSPLIEPTLGVPALGEGTVMMVSIDNSHLDVDGLPINLIQGEPGEAPVKLTFANGAYTATGQTLSFHEAESLGEFLLLQYSGTDRQTFYGVASVSEDRDAMRVWPLAFQPHQEEHLRKFANLTGPIERNSQTADTLTINSVVDLFQAVRSFEAVNNWRTGASPLTRAQVLQASRRVLSLSYAVIPNEDEFTLFTAAAKFLTCLSLAGHPWDRDVWTMGAGPVARGVETDKISQSRALKACAYAETVTKSGPDTRAMMRSLMLRPNTQARGLAMIRTHMAQGDWMAHILWAEALATGTGMARDPAAALDHLSKHMPTMPELILAYPHVYALAKDTPLPRDQAVAMAQKAADAGHPVGMVLAGMAMIDGDGAARNRVGGLALLDRAADAGAPLAGYMRAMMDHQAMYDPPRPQSMVEEDLFTAAQRGWIEAQYLAGQTLRAGKNPEEIHKARFWLSQAARERHPMAAIADAHSIAFGHGSPRDVPAARALLDGEVPGKAPAERNKILKQIDDSLAPQYDQILTLRSAEPEMRSDGRMSIATAFQTDQYIVRLDVMESRAFCLWNLYSQQPAMNGQSRQVQTIVVGFDQACSGTIIVHDADMKQILHRFELENATNAATSLTSAMTTTIIDSLLPKK